jgi:predicted RNA-binding protein with PUA-like domain
MAHWLVKTEPDVFSIDDFARSKVTDWTGVRNYQAEEVLVYHSNAQPPGVVGLARVHKPASPDETQFDKSSEYFDSKASRESPRWFCPDLQFVRKLKRPISLDELRTVKALSGLLLLERGSRLSVIPVSDKHFHAIVELSARNSK